MDTIASGRLDAHQIKEVPIYLSQTGGMMVDVKYEANITPFNKITVNQIEENVEIFFKKFPLQNRQISLLPHKTNQIEEQTKQTPVRKLDILICTLNKRKRKYEKLKEELNRQIKENKLDKSVVVMSFPDNGDRSIGYKRNTLLEMSLGEYVCFLDDDDMISSDYVKELYNATLKGADCVAFNVELNTGKIKTPYLFSKEHKEYSFKNNCYLRPVGHLCPIKREIAIKYKFKELPKESDRGSDVHWALDLVRNNAIKTEVKVEKVLYFYHRKF